MPIKRFKPEQIVMMAVFMFTWTGINVTTQNVTGSATKCRCCPDISGKASGSSRHNHSRMPYAATFPG